MTYEPAAGETIAETAKQMVKMVAKTGEPATATFNGIELAAAIGTSESKIVDGYTATRNRRAEEYRTSPVGQKAAREAQEFQRRAETSAAEGIKPFGIGDENAWRKYVENNQDGYGACCVRYAARWACAMEQAMAAGAALETVADKTSHEANTEGITGFMYSCAVSMLARCWEHGEELRRWHSLKTQIRNEGELANESGGVLNPAPLRVG